MAKDMSRVEFRALVTEPGRKNVKARIVLAAAINGVPGVDLWIDGRCVELSVKPAKNVMTFLNFQYGDKQGATGAKG